MTKVDQFAKDFADAVLEAFIRIYGAPKRSEARESIWSSWSDKGIRTGWTDPSPRVAVVNTEHAWIPDPWASDEDHRHWESVAAFLTKAGWGDVHFDSINPGIQVVFIDLPPAWSQTLTRRAVARSG